MMRTLAIVAALVLFRGTIIGQSFNLVESPIYTQLSAQNSHLPRPVRLNSNTVSNGQWLSTSGPESIPSWTADTLQMKFKKDVDQYFSSDLIVGTWIPQGQNRVLGVHPSLGFEVGGWYGKFLYDLALEFRFVKAAHDYTVQYEGNTETTHHYFGGFLGIHAGYAFLNTANTSVYVLGGIGLDGFDAVEQDYYHDHSLSINTFNKNVGFGIRRFYKDGGFIGAEVLYNFINYQNPGGTPLGGNGISVRLLFGKVHPLENR